MPEVKAAAARGSASATLRHSAWVAGGLTAAASLGLLLVLGPLSQLLFGDKFETSTSLVVAVVSVGVVRVAHSFAFAAATALVPEDELPGLAFLGTVAAAVVVAGAVVGARWGLHGIIYGAVPGWLFRTGVYASKANMAMRRHIVKLA
jgi:O-antigen/teichoic acid export membrane protein